MSFRLVPTSVTLNDLEGRKTEKMVFFSLRVVNVWNKLPAHVVEALSVNCFKKRLDDWSMDVET